MRISTRIIGDLMHTERLENGQRRLLRDLVVEVEGERITVPEDTVSDFSSIPWFGRLIVRWSKVDIAGVVHDWLYKSGVTTREKADKIWRLVAISGDHHANAFQAYVGWICLRLCGWIVWQRYRNNQEK